MYIIKLLYITYLQYHYLIKIKLSESGGGLCTCTCTCISIHFLHFQTFQWKVLPVNKMVLFEDNNIQDYHVCALKIRKGFWTYHLAFQEWQKSTNNINWKMMNITPPIIPTYIQSTKQKQWLSGSNLSNPLHSIKFCLCSKVFHRQSKSELKCLHFNSLWGKFERHYLWT